MTEKENAEIQNEQQDSKQRILVVDDEASIRRILETRLKMIGYDIITAADGEEAIASFNKNNPDLIVLDVMMPKIDGSKTNLRRSDYHLDSIGRRFRKNYRFGTRR